MMNTFTKATAAIVAFGLIASGAVAIATQAPKPGPKSEAETIAETFLKAGSDLFDAKDASRLAATYTEDGEILLIGNRDGETTEDVKRGRAAIEEFYRDYFRVADAI